MANRIKCECNANTFYTDTKAFNAAVKACKGYHKAGQVKAYKPVKGCTVNQAKPLKQHPMIAHLYGVYLSAGDFAGKWYGPKSLHPMAETVVPANAIKTGNGEVWALPETVGHLCECTKYYFKPHSKAFIKTRKGEYVDNSQFVNIAPGTDEYKGYNVNTAPAVSSLQAAGVYMPDINLHLGFDSVVNKARNELKRELVKSERKPLFIAFVRAANAYQLIQLPNQEIAPFAICGGTVWDATEGSINKFSVLVDKTMLRLFGRTMTRKEGVFIREQWPALTRARRASGSPLDSMRNGGLASVGMGDTTSRARTMGELWKRGSEYTKQYILNNAQGTKADNSQGALYFDYRGEVAALRARLKAGDLSHELYNAAYAALKNKRAKQLELLETVKKNNTRNMHKNSGAIRIIHNAQGYAPEKAPNASKRFAIDDYPVNDSEEGATIVIDNMKSPTVYKDGIVTNADTRKPIIMKRKKRVISKD